MRGIPGAATAAEPRIHLKLDMNERHLPLPGDILGAIHRAWQDLPLHRYPAAGAEDLKADLARTYGFPAEDIVLGSGADEVILLLALAARGRVGQMVMPEPTFGVYRWAADLAGLPVRGVPFDLTSRSLPVEQLLATAGGAPCLLFLCRPNNPTGHLWPLDQVRCLVESLPRGSLAVLDEAYWEYAGEHAAAWALGRDDTALLRTFSKAFGLAGMRCGWAVVPSSWRKAVSRVRMPFNVSGAALVAARVVLRYRTRLEAEALAAAATRDRLAGALAEVPGAVPLPSRANFVLVELAGGETEALAAAAGLRQRGIAVRTYAGNSLVGHCLRFSTGPPEEAGEVVAALATVLAEIRNREAVRGRGAVRSRDSGGGTA